MNIFRFVIVDQNNRIMRSSNGYFDAYIKLPEPFTLEHIVSTYNVKPINSGLFVERITKKMERAHHNDIIRLSKLTDKSLICHGEEWLGIVCFEKYDEK
jgi:hypothetical protein